MLLLWLRLFSAETEEDLRKIVALGVPVMNQAIKAYNEITVTSKFVEAARLRDLAAHNEASALRHARLEGQMTERKVWQGVVAEKDAENERLRAESANKDAENERLREQLARFQAKPRDDA
jgi:lactam utilization protein B